MRTESISKAKKMMAFVATMVLVFSLFTMAIPTGMAETAEPADAEPAETAEDEVAFIRASGPLFPAEPEETADIGVVAYNETGHRVEGATINVTENPEGLGDIEVGDTAETNERGIAEFSYTEDEPFLGELNFTVEGRPEIWDTASITVVSGDAAHMLMPDAEPVQEGDEGEIEVVALDLTLGFGGLWLAEGVEIRVEDNDDGLDGIRVNDTATTNNMGEAFFDFEEDEAGTYLVNFTAPDFDDLETQIEVLVYGEIQEITTFEVNGEPAADVEQPINITGGEEVSFYAEAEDVHGNAITDQRAFDWEDIRSVDADAATFDHVHAGNYTVQAEIGALPAVERTEEINITVEDPGIDRIIFTEPVFGIYDVLDFLDELTGWEPWDYEDFTAAEYGYLLFSVEAHDEDGDVITTSAEDFEWTDAPGGFFTSSPGDYEVSATFDGEDYNVTSEVIEFRVLAPAEFEVEITSPEDTTEYEPGEEIEVEYTVENTGDFEDTQRFTFYERRFIDSSEEVTLGPGDTYDGTFTTSFDDPGNYTLTVFADNSDSVEIAVVDPDPPDPAYFEVTITDYDDEVEEGETVTVEYTVENTGDEEGTQDIVFTVDGDQEATEEVTLDGGEDYSGTFTWEAEEEGDYDLEVASDDTSDSVTVTVLEEEIETPGFTIMLLILGAVIAVAVYYKKEQ